MPKEENKHRRIVVEEVSTPEEPVAVVPEPQSYQQPQETNVISEVKSKVEELQSLTKDISENVEKSETLQEEIVEEVDNIEEPVAPPEATETLPTPIPQPPQMIEEIVPQIKNSGTNPLVILIPGLFLLGALLGGIYFYQKGIGIKPSASIPPTESTVLNDTPTPSPASSPSATLVLSKYPVNIKNGSGTPGEANKVKTILTTGGFSVSGTGNATSYDYTKTVIKAKADVPAAFITQVSTLLGKTYVMDTNQTLITSSADSVQVIVGSTKVK
jgi:hypothetical protein